MSESLPDKRQTLRDINASDAFRNTLLPRRDAVTDGGYPLWHGWAIMDAFLAGADYARSHEPQNAAPQMPGSCVSTGAEARVQSPVVVHGEPLLQKTPTATSADAASASSTTPRSDETPSRVVWVIEKGSPAQYFAGFNYGAGKWTPDFARALHAADREQAQSLWDCDRSVFAIFNDDCRIADHIICGGPAFTPSATPRKLEALRWASDTFGLIACDEQERAMRFAEEAAELVHAIGLERTVLEAIVARVYGRQAGEVAKEIGQAMLTLDLLGQVVGVDASEAGALEFERVQKIPKDEWDRRHRAKVAEGIAK